MQLTNARQKVLRQLQSRQGRKKSDYVVCEGWHVCGEAVQAAPEWIEFGVVSESAVKEELWSGTESDFPVHVVTESEFAQFAQTETPQGVLLVLRRPEPAVASVELPFFLVLDRIADPGNLGSVLRSCHAVGLRQVFATAGTTDAWGAKALRAGMGAQFHVSLSLFDDVAAVRDWLATVADCDIWLTSPHAGIDCFDDAFALAGNVLVMGNEAAGTGNVEGARHVNIPMPGTAESLNVAQATTVLLFDAVRRGVL